MKRYNIKTNKEYQVFLIIRVLKEVKRNVDEALKSTLLTSIPDLERKIKTILKEYPDLSVTTLTKQEIEFCKKVVNDLDSVQDMLLVLKMPRYTLARIRKKYFPRAKPLLLPKEDPIELRITKLVKSNLPKFKELYLEYNGNLSRISKKLGLNTAIFCRVARNLGMPGTHNRYSKAEVEKMISTLRKNDNKLRKTAKELNMSHTVLNRAIRKLFPKQKIVNDAPIKKKNKPKKTMIMPDISNDLITQTYHENGKDIAKTAEKLFLKVEFLKKIIKEQRINLRQPISSKVKKFELKIEDIIEAPSKEDALKQFVIKLAESGYIYKHLSLKNI